MKKVILPILMSSMFIIPAVSHAEENVVSQKKADTIEQVQEKRGWFQGTGYWLYYNEDGSLAIGWKNINGKWYHFDETGMMATYMKNIQGKTYYFNEDGSMQIGWKKVRVWHYFNEDGSMAKDWKKSMENGITLTKMVTCLMAVGL